MVKVAHDELEGRGSLDFAEGLLPKPPKREPR